MTWIRLAYLYLFALVGLVLITTGSVQLVDLGLRAWVFTEADAELRLRGAYDPPMRIAPGRAETLADDSTLDPATREALRHWAEDYTRIREQQESIDPVRSQRERQAGGALALLLVGLPLYAYHWRTIKRERGAATKKPGPRE